MGNALELVLYALAWASVLAVGAVHPITQVVLAWVALVLFAVAVVGPLRRKGLRVTPPTWVALAAFAWTAFQLLPLPLSLLGVLSPNAAALRGELGSGAAPITLDVAATRLELVKQLIYLAFFLLGTTLLRRSDAMRRLAIALGALGVVMTTFIFAHRVLGMPFLFGLYTPAHLPGSGYFPPFVNGNHAASVLALSALASFGLAAATQRGPRFAWLSAGVLTTVALLATQSRGGAVGLTLGAFVLGAALACAHFGRVRGLMIASAVLVTLGVGTLVLADGLRSRFSHSAPGESTWSNQKTRGWLAAEKLALAYPLTGVGRGAFEAPAAAQRQDTEGIRLIYPDDILLQAASEWGIVLGIGLILAALVTTGSILLRLDPDPISMGLLGGVIAVAFYGGLECGFEVPGVMTPFVLAVAALVARVEADHRERRRARPRLGMLTMAIQGVLACGVIVLGIRALPHTLDAESARLRADVVAKRNVPTSELDAIIARHPASAEIEMIAGELAMDARDPSALHHLSRAMRLQPSLPRPHELAAIQLLRLHRPAQAALELRLTQEHKHNINDAELIRFVGAHAVDAALQNGDALASLGAAYAAQQRWPDAERAFARAEELGGDPHIREQRLLAYATAPAPLRLSAIDAVVKQTKSGDELAHAVHALYAMNDVERGDAVLADGTKRYPESALLVAEGARSLAARNDLEGARRMLGKIGRFDPAGRVVLGELAVELAQRAGDVDGAAAAKARLKLLRAHADLEKDTSQ